MRYFIDTEFSERGPGKPIDLISIGVVAEDGREFYACNRDFKRRHASPWVRENVLPLLPEQNPTPPPYGSPRLAREALAWMPFKEIRGAILDFIGYGDTPEFWTYFGAFDYVVLSQIMGGMVSWPNDWPYYALDLRQWLDERDLQHVKQPDDAPHDALQDARWIRETYQRYTEVTA
jgi:hypothetical protein